jgi:hypothetical protein
MSKFAKRLRKIKKFPQFAVSIGDTYENFSDIVSVFQTVFVVDAVEKKYREKNLIYLDDISKLSIPNGVDMIFAKEDNKNSLLNLQHIIRQNRPLIFLHSKMEISISQADFFKKIQYHATDTFGEYQIWKMNG